MDNYRSVLEVLRFSEPKETLRAAEEVQRAWGRPSRSQELWQDYCDWAGVPILPGVTAKRSFKTSPPMAISHLLIGEKDLLLVIELDTFAIISVKIAAEMQFNDNIIFCQTHIQAYIGISLISRVYQVNIGREICVLPAASPLQNRGNAGLLKYRYFLYAFGGVSGTNLQRTIEKYTIPADTWRLLPCKMKEYRASFTPCQYGSKAYLVGSCLPVESFDLSTEDCVYLPFSVDSWEVWSFASVKEQELVVVLRNRLLKVQLARNNQQFQAISIEPSTEKPPKSSFIPKLLDKDADFITIFLYFPDLSTAHQITLSRAA
jgi:hypothetical protein